MQVCSQSHHNRNHQLSGGTEFGPPFEHLCHKWRHFQYLCHSSNFFHRLAYCFRDIFDFIEQYLFIYRNNDTILIGLTEQALNSFTLSSSRCQHLHAVIFTLSCAPTIQIRSHGGHEPTEFSTPFQATAASGPN